MEEATGKRRDDGKDGMEEPERGTNHPEGDEELKDGASGGFGISQHGLRLWA